MGLAVLLDSVILIDHLNGVRAATAYLKTTKDSAISAITRAEVLSGGPEDQFALIARWLDTFRLIPIDARIADRAAQLRRTHRWRLADALQAAAALEHGALLATRNTKDFPPAKHAFVRVPYAI